MSVRLFLNGCNGRMGQVITDLVSDTDDLVIVAGSDISLGTPRSYPVFNDDRGVSVDFECSLIFNPAACRLV
jgi:4-hydroxy-tetrahydrodipicolinate reductase